jgi:ATP-dependent helicase HrpB
VAEQINLPIDAVLPQLIATLRAGRAAVLTAPPGAGKSTRVPLALLDAGLVQGQLVLLQPRRLAARAVARTMARALGEAPGRTVGHRVRFDDCSSAETRILVVTEGILTRRLLGDPLLEGVGCVILDEFHERSLHADLALAFLREVCEVRDDLRILVMSATLRAGPICRFLGDCPHVVCETRQHPLTIEHVEPVPGAGRRRERSALARSVRRAVHSLLDAADDDDGDILVFLPGAAEIEQVRRLLEEDYRGPEPVPLHGALDAAAQDRVLAPGQARRRVVLATNIAETSLTVPRVTAVVDAGLVKQPRFDARVGLDRLELVRISKSSADQRAGRAGRLSPGRALRLWSRADHAGLLEADLPEIQRVDLAQALLAVLSFHPGDPARFPFFEPPAPANLEAALASLRLLGALQTPEHRLSERGRRLALLPVPPRVGAMLEQGSRVGLRRDAALLAAILSERDPLPRDATVPTVESDLLLRRDLLEADGAPRLDRGAARAIRQAAGQLLRLTNGAPVSPAVPAGDDALRRLVLAGYPDRVCRRRGPGSDLAVMVGGRGVRLSEGSGVREAELFVALWVEAGARGTHAAALVRMASAVDRADLEAAFPELVAEEEETYYDEVRDRVLGRRVQRFADLVVHEVAAAVDPALAAELLAEQAARRFDDLFRPNRPARQLIARLRLAAVHLPDGRWPDASPQGLRARLPELCAGLRSLEELRELDWRAVLESRLGERERRRLDRELPERISVPSGRAHVVDYAEAYKAGTGAPVLAVKLQEMFGLADTPRLLGGRLPLTLHLLAPNGRPVQVTRDLRSFWDETYHQVRKDLRGRYPKHPWPEDPWSASASAGTRRRRRS